MFATKEEARVLIANVFTEDQHEIVVNPALNSTHMIQVRRRDGRSFGGLEHRINVNEVLDLLRIRDPQVTGVLCQKHDTLLFTVYVAPIALPRPKSAWAILSSLVALLDYKVPAAGISPFEFDDELGALSFSVRLDDTVRADVQHAVFAFENYLNYFGVRGTVVIAELRRRPPYVRYAQTRIIVTVPGDALLNIDYDRSILELAQHQSSIA